MASLLLALTGCVGVPTGGTAPRSTTAPSTTTPAGSPGSGQPAPDAIFSPPPAKPQTSLSVATPQAVSTTPADSERPRTESTAVQPPTVSTPVPGAVTPTVLLGSDLGKPSQESWLPWEAWQRENHAFDATFFLGQHYLLYRGVQNYVGFEPRLAKGQLFVNRLDLQKNLMPLLTPVPRWDSGGRSIVIDPGHGGVNGGTQTLHGHQLEKNLTLDWALRLRSLLERRGWHVWLTRTNDVDRPMAERIDFSEASGADLFISLHFNAGGGNQSAAGIETYCLTPVGMASTITREYVDDSGKAYPNNRFDTQNLQLAMSVHRSLLMTVGAVDRGVRRARFMDAIRWQARPAILIEGGYLTNPAESARIIDPAYRQKLAEGVARALD